MMLLGDFYHITSMQSEMNTSNVSMELNPQHAIFEGHFPGKPVVPGVCMMQMVKEMLSFLSGRPVMLSTADTIKFLSVINPDENKAIEMQLQYETGPGGLVQVNASIYIKEKVCFKFKGSFVNL
ncbi:MAG: hypothetical protein WKF89_03925 [Chitinophagaceae bacterium]